MQYNLNLRNSPLVKNNQNKAWTYSKQNIFTKFTERTKIWPFKSHTRTRICHLSSRYYIKLIYYITFCHLTQELTGCLKLLSTSRACWTNIYNERNWLYTYKFNILFPTGAGNSDINFTKHWIICNPTGIVPKEKYCLKPNGSYKKKINDFDHSNPRESLIFPDLIPRLNISICSVILVIKSWLHKFK